MQGLGGGMLFDQPNDFKRLKAAVWWDFGKWVHDMRKSEAVLLATQEALKSTEAFRLGAVVLRKGSVVGRGRNRNVNPCGLPSIHAEMNAVWTVPTKNLPKKHLHLVVVRVLKDCATMACSKPCEACSRALIKRGFSTVTYTTGDPHRPVACLNLISD